MDLNKCALKKKIYCSTSKQKKPELGCYKKVCTFRHKHFLLEFWKYITKLYLITGASFHSNAVVSIKGYLLEKPAKGPNFFLICIYIFISYSLNIESLITIVSIKLYLIQHWDIVQRAQYYVLRCVDLGSKYTSIEWVNRICLQTRLILYFILGKTGETGLFTSIFSVP